MDFRLAHKQLGIALNELQTMRSDRAVGILGGAMVDDALTLAFVAKWRFDESGRTTKARETFIREGGGPITFSLMIDLAYLTKLIGPDVHSDLVNIKDIRNKFAHRLTMDDHKQLSGRVTFRSQQISAWCNNLKGPQKIASSIDRVVLQTKTPKQMFLSAVVMYVGAFFLYANNPDKEPKVIDSILKR